MLLGSALFGQAPQADYQRDVHPLLAEKCFACHGGDKRSGGLSLKDYASALEGGRSGAVIEPGDAAGSLLMRRVSGEVKPLMPPAGPPLNERELAVLRRWIDNGARPAVDAAPARKRWTPTLSLVKPSRTPEQILADYFAEKKLTPALVGDAAYARRVYLDAWGLLPSPEQLREFVTDKSADKRARLVRQLLDHRQNYAGNWATFWNDLLRNEDNWGTYGGDRKSISTWLYQALEDNVPYDKFVEKLLNPGQSGAEGFLIGVNWRGDINASQTPHMQAAQNSAQIFLGINLKCNSCHDSFISKWKLKDAYALAAFFSKDEKLELVRCDNATGQFATPSFLYPELNHPAGMSLDERHAAVASMFLDPRNGRTPRTVVNRIWAKLIGRGIVEPVDEMDGEPWSPELLDRLSADFVEQGWDMKKLIATIMSLPAYQMTAVDRDADKNYTFRGPSIRRLNAEQFIDSLSAITGEWPVWRPRDEGPAKYVREARLMSSPLSRALGRPIRDQVTSERPTEATTLQALELVNGQDLYAMIYRGARKMLGQQPAAPAPLAYSGVMGGRSKPREFDIDVTGLKKLWLVVGDEGSYAPPAVKTDWVTSAFGTIAMGTNDVREIDLSGKGLTRFKASAALNEASKTSDISPSVRFYVFKEKPNMERLIPVLPQQPVPAPEGPFTTDSLVSRVFRHALGRDATASEAQLARAALGAKPTPETLADLLWSLAMMPEFQLVL